MVCKTCGATHESADFYPSIKTYCKAHWRERVSANRAKKADYYKAYDRARANLLHRVEARREYVQTPNGAQKVAEARSRYAAKRRGGRPARSERQPLDPVLSAVRRKARIIVGNAIRDGDLSPWPACAHPEGCDHTKVEAHHPDYSRPLDVVWLCPAHHKQAHALASQVLSANNQNGINSA